MSVLLLLALLFVGGLLAWPSDRLHPRFPAAIALCTLLLGIVLWLSVFSSGGGYIGDSAAGWWYHFQLPWIERFGISVQFAVDGLSYMLVLLGLVLAVLAVFSAWSEIRHRIGFFYLNLLWSVAGIVGVFVSLDLFLFFFFWEVMLLPMVMLIGIWGHENRRYAAIKFFIFTQASSLFMLLAIVALVLLYYQQTGVLTFNYFSLLHAQLAPDQSYWIMLGFFIAFAVKMPVVPWHTWLPDAHTQAPTAGSVLLAAVLLKTGAYGLIRFCLALFPDASAEFAPVAMTLAVLGILYAAKLAMAQHDFKRLVAYTSISHMGFVLLGIYAMNRVALHGAVLQMIAHALSSAALFMLAGMLQERLHSRDMRSMGGLWHYMPRFATFTLFFVAASLGLPGLANFVAEFIVLLGSFADHPLFTALAALGLIAAAVYSLIIIQRSCWGAVSEQHQALVDLNWRETLCLVTLALATVYFGLFPQSLIDPVVLSVQNSLSAVLAESTTPYLVSELSP